MNKKYLLNEATTLAIGDTTNFFVNKQNIAIVKIDIPLLKKAIKILELLDKREVELVYYDDGVLFLGEFDLTTKTGKGVSIAPLNR